MALFGRLITLARSPQGRKLIVQAQRAARDPQNRERLEQVRKRIQSRGGATPTKPVGAQEPPAPPQRSADAANDA